MPPSEHARNKGLGWSLASERSVFIRDTLTQEQIRRREVSPVEVIGFALRHTGGTIRWPGDAPPPAAMDGQAATTLSRNHSTWVRSPCGPPRLETRSFSSGPSASSEAGELSAGSTPSPKPSRRASSRLFSRQGGERPGLLMV